MGASSALLALVAMGGCTEDLFAEPDGGMVTVDMMGGGDDFSAVFAALGSSCADCHAPGAPGFTTGTEATQDWSSESAAQSSLLLNASGLVAPFDACNGVPLVVPGSPEQSLIMAYLDAGVRASFADGDCTGAALVDGTIRATVSGAGVEALRSWIAAGAP
ncbi:MAG: hypothetical protein AAF447_08310 [Myxococcota bacterium]